MTKPGQVNLLLRNERELLNNSSLNIASGLPCTQMKIMIFFSGFLLRLT